ncbi:histidine kinase [Mycolicibacterium chubuense]|uniref:Hypoxic response protein 1 n=1 Tax=Mycolicibacterium chubuense TaxID=1800 RepID=A0A0J6VHV4_MYCCU|nr:CBS domain-containing protein [Mycolicibacterium chubuense]KMO69859.1 Hypoxic response protein 1 [Mycolicibacterium chubuense]ORA53307.1 histidine kinase [Mycolicibacterium chubuense]SPX96516.1 signal-transduction protein [Mycolicibacterium chubuense]
MTEIKSIGSLDVSTVTGGPVVRVPAGATVADAARALVAHDVGMVVLGDGDGDVPSAVLSERDIVRVVAAGRDPADVAAAEVATTKLVWASADDTVDEVAEQMMEHYIRHVLVERDGALLGVVSARDLLGVYTAGAAGD